MADESVPESRSVELRADETIRVRRPDSRFSLEIHAGEGFDTYRVMVYEAYREGELLVSRAMVYVDANGRMSLSPDRGF